MADQYTVWKKALVSQRWHRSETPDTHFGHSMVLDAEDGSYVAWQRIDGRWVLIFRNHMSKARLLSQTLRDFVRVRVRVIADQARTSGINLPQNLLDRLISSEHTRHG